jgi:hypothetical protein
MLRFVVLLLLTLGLFVGCQAYPSTPTISEWEIGDTGKTITVKPIKTTTPFIWWEAEKPMNTNFPASDRHSFVPANATEAAVLSEGRWVGIEGKRADTLFLEYQVNVNNPGSYFLYSRKFWQHGPFRWRWDGQPWQQVGHNPYLMDRVGMRQFVEVNWVSLGKVDLTTGVHRFRIELTENDGAAAFDCFVLTQAPLQPQGKLRPNQQYEVNILDGFLFNPGVDFFAASPIDLRSLNESQAGENGFIQVKGENFIHAKTGQPERFWAVNVGMESIQMDAVTLKSMARFLAKRGVNMVRLHGPLWSENLQTISPSAIQPLFAFIAAMKNEGIYTCLSIYFPIWLNLDASNPLTSQFAGYSGQHPFALLFFNAQFQEIYEGWWRSLLTTVNPATGKTLKEDPALAMVELVNEDSYFFWTFNPYETIPQAQIEILEQQFGAWLTTKYGSLEQAQKEWTEGNKAISATVKGDHPNAGRMGFLPLWQLVQQRQSQRAQDTAAFLAGNQQQFFQRAIAFLRKDLGYQGLIYASNWITADAQILGPLDKFTNTVADFMDRHGYFSGPHEGPNAAYALNPGETYEDHSALLFQSSDQKQAQDFNLPIMDIRYNGKPSTITEINWPMPNRFRADFPLLAAAYGSLQESDGFFFFVTNRPAWEAQLGKFEIATPAIMGQFPATAFIYRKGLIQPGETVVDVSLNIKDIFQLKGAPVAAPQNLDEFRAKDIPTGQVLQTNQAQSIDPLAFLVGKVNLNFTTTENSARQVELSQWIDRKAKTIQSSTKQLRWDYGQGLVTVNAPQVQGATGFLQQAGDIKLRDMQIKSDLDYGTILLVALDNQPIAQSRRILLQVMSEEQNVGWKTTGSPRKTIQSVGSPPAIAVRNLSGQISLQRSDAQTLKVTALDFNGYPTTQLGNAAHFSLQPNRLYYLIEKFD